MSNLLGPGLDALQVESPWRVTGQVARVTTHELEVRGLRLKIGDALRIRGAQGLRQAEVIALTPEGARVLPYGEVSGIGKGDTVTSDSAGLTMRVSEQLVGRVIDGLGRPLDGGPELGGEAIDVSAPAPSPLERVRINDPLPTGVRLLDTFCTAGKGQRIGIFGGSGVGKSTLLGMMARGTGADVAVLALIGERGREVREFIEDELGPEGMARSIVVVATSDQPALMRLRASLLATRISEWFADRGAHVLLLMDSLTRLAMAQREIGLAAGEPPTARGYTPSVFALMARMLERAGPRAAGTITGYYSVLVEGDDMNDPIADTTRAILDGHIVLDRRIAISGRYPAIDPLASLSRLAPRLVSEDHRSLVIAAQDALAAAEEVRELVEVGAYVPGTNPAADRGLAAKPALVEFLRQPSHEVVPFDQAWAQLDALRAQIGLAA
ncbi:MAG: FliI/YscN family ATPase [Acidimicrobiia bacterium]|nr:FliI/YscN family ATPase [Acidimicrobiia bacterium]